MHAHTASNAAATAPPPSPLPARPLRRYADLPGPRRLPLLGNLLQIDAPRLHLQLEQWCCDFGPYFRLKLGRREVLVVGDHAVVAAMLRDRPDGFGRTPRLLEIWLEMGLPVGLFGANGDTWRAQRRMVMAGFDPAHVKRYFPAMVQVAQRLCRRWQRAAGQGTAIDLQADLMRYTVDTIAGLAFGADVNTLESGHDVIQQHLDKLFPALFKRILAPLPTWRLWRSAADRQLEHSITEVKAAVHGFIGQARARMQANPGLRQRPDNLLEAMIAAADAPGSGIDDAQVAGNVLTMLLAGEDTTANTIAWMVYLLWQHPAALARATSEVRRVCGAGLNTPTLAPTLAQMDQLDFVEACALETMRLKPVAPQLPLQAMRDTVLGDVQVPAGMVVIGLLRRDAVSEQHVLRASAFEPERWLVDSDPGQAGDPGDPGQRARPGSAGPFSQAANPARRISMPFGAGPRICPGRYLALLEMKLALATLLGQFDIADVRTPDGRAAQERLSFTMTPVGLALHLRLRASAPSASARPGVGRASAPSG